MAVVNVKESFQTQAPKTKEGTKATRIFSVLLDGDDSTTEAPFVAREATGIPDIGDSYPNRSFLFCDSVIPNAKSEILFDIKVDYSTVQLHLRGGEPTENPLKADPDVEWDFVVSSEPVDWDILGNPIVNSSRELFDPPVVDEIYDLCLRVGRNERRFNENHARNFCNTVNKRAFLGWPAGTACLKVYRGTRLVTGRYEYWRVSYEVHFRLDGWKRRIADRGYRELIGENADKTPKYQEILDKNNRKITSPELLNGQGRKLPKDHIDAKGDPIRAVWLHFDRKKSADWLVLDLDKF